jgi:hypothetical protein
MRSRHPAAFNRLRDIARTWVRLHEKGGKLHEMPCHHNLEDYITNRSAI